MAELGRVSVSTPEEAEAHGARPRPFRPTWRTVAQASVEPITRVARSASGTRAQHDGGVFDGEGQPVTEGLHVPAAATHFPQGPAMALPRRHLAGRWLFAGYTRRHFGQFILDGMGRMWPFARRDLGQVEGVVFIHYPGRKDATAEGIAHDAGRVEAVRWMRDLVESVAGPVKIVVAGGSLAVDELVVPNNIAGGMILGGEASFRAMCALVARRIDDAKDDAFSHAAAVPATRRMYISRSALPVNLSHFMLEDLIEENLRRNGYAIFHPQAFSIPDQLAAYRRVDDIVMAEGSAGHLLAMVAKPEQRVAVIARRPQYERFTNQLRSFGVEGAVTIAAVRSQLLPADAQAAASHTMKTNAPTVLDFDALRDGLAGRGLISADSWRSPSEEEMRQACRRYAVRRNALAGERGHPLHDYVQAMI